MIMKPQEFPKATTDSIPVADMLFNASERGVTMTQTYPIRQPERDANDFKIQVWASSLHRNRRRLQKIEERSFPWGEVLLSVSTFAAGAIASALTTSITLNSLSGIIFFVILPMVAVGSFVAYLFNRTTSLSNASEIAREVLQELPDPDKTI
jgi:hypothetical protein